MPRSTNAAASRKRRKRCLKQARGFMGSRHRLFRTATEAVDKAMGHAFVGRKQKKRQYRSLWVVRINAACALNHITYSQFMGGLAKVGIALNRKMLSEIAIHDAEGFSALVKQVQAAQA